MISIMTRFNKWEFKQIIENLERDEMNDDNVWVAVGILERMYNDDCGYIDEFFSTNFVNRNWEKLWDKLQDHIIRNQL